MMRVEAAAAGETLACSQLRSLAWTSCAWAGVATLPVPMAQMGSYATTTFDQSDPMAFAYACRSSSSSRCGCRVGGGQKGERGGQAGRHGAGWRAAVAGVGAGGFIVCHALESTHRQLRGDDVERLAGVALGEGLAQARDGGDAVVQGGARLGGDDLVGLALLPALRVADDRVPVAQVLQHRRRDLTRVGARRGEDILQAERWRGRGDRRWRATHIARAVASK